MYIHESSAPTTIRTDNPNNIIKEESTKLWSLFEDISDEESIENKPTIITTTTKPNWHNNNITVNIIGDRSYTANTTIVNTTTVHTTETVHTTNTMNTNTFIEPLILTFTTSNNNNYNIDNKILQSEYEGIIYWKIKKNQVTCWTRRK